MHVHGEPGQAPRALAALLLLDRRGRRLVYSPHDTAPGEGRLQSWARTAAIAHGAAVGDTQEEVGQLASAGAEAWLSPITAQPAAVDVAHARAWAREDSQIVLYVGAVDGDPLAERLTGVAERWDPAARVLSLWGPATEAAQHVQLTTSPVASVDLPATVAAADLVVLGAGRAVTPPVRRQAGQFGTRVLELDHAASAQEAADAIDRALTKPAPPRSQPGGAARALRKIYGLPEPETAAASANAPHPDANAPTPTSATTRPGRTELAVVAWTNSTGRTTELAEALGGEGRTFYDLNITDRRLIPLRYALSSLRMVAYLVRHRPRTLIVSNPPIIPPVIGFLYAKLTGARLLLDSQTASFGEKDSGIGRAMLPIHRFIAKRSTCTLVGAEPLADRVREWGGDAEVFHEAPPAWAVDPPVIAKAPLRVLWIGVYAADEPLDALLEAAAQLPEVEFRVTGDLRKAPADYPSAPPNVTWLGFVRGRAYPHELERADVVIAMTTDPGSALRGGLEAIYAERPLITSDVPFLRDLFPEALYATNDADGIVNAVRAVQADPAAALKQTRVALDVQLARWRPQLARLQHWSAMQVADSAFGVTATQSPTSADRIPAMED